MGAYLEECQWRKCSRALLNLPPVYLHIWTNNLGDKISTTKTLLKGDLSYFDNKGQWEDGEKEGTLVNINNGDIVFIEEDSE